MTGATVARTSPWRAETIGDHGGYTIMDPLANTIRNGEGFDLTAEDVIEICTPEPVD